MKRAAEMSPFPLKSAAPRGRLCSRLAKRGRPSGNGDRETIVVGAGQRQ